MSEAAGESAYLPVSSLTGGLRRERWLLCLWVGVGLIGLLNYAWTIRDLTLGWIETGRLVFGLVIVVATVILVRDRWPQIRREPVRPSSWGWAFLAFSFVSLFVGTRADLVFVRGMTSVFLRGLSLISLLCGVVLLTAGRAAMRHLWMPALLLAFMYPENALTSYWVPLRLQTLAAILSDRAIALIGIPVIREGHVLETAAIAANVEEACSGIRSLSTVVPTAIFISAYGLRRFWTKLALIVLAVPVTLFANVVRVVVTILVGTYVSTRAAQGFFHYFAGFGIFVFCLLILLVLWDALQGLEMRRGGRTQTRGRGLNRAASQPGPAGWQAGRRVLRRGALAVSAFLVLGIAYQGLEIGCVMAARHRPRARPLASIPASIGKWTSVTLPDPEDLERGRHVSDAMFREYRAPGEPAIRVNLLYWRTGEGTFLGRRAHLPESCYPFHGMAELWSKTEQLKTGSELLPEVEVRTSAFAAPGGPVIVTSWQQAGLRGGELKRRAYTGKIGQLIYGLREILRIKSDYPAEIAIQLSTSEGGPEDRIVSAQKRLASLLIRQAAEVLLAEAESTD